MILNCQCLTVKLLKRPLDPVMLIDLNTVMVFKIFDDLYAFIWEDYSQNNCNTYLITGSKNILIDPGHKHLIDHVNKGLSTLNISTIDVIIITHGHPDHMEAISLFDKPCLVSMSQKEHEFIKEFANGYFKIPEPDFFLKAGDLAIGEHRFEVIETPGHSPGSICLYWPERKVLFTGDVVFNQGIGRTDIPGGDSALLKQSILKIKGLDTEFVFSGHGEPVVGKKAVKKNFQIIEEQWFNYL